MSQSFADLGVSAPVARALADRGITTPFPIQALVVADVLAGHDVLAQSPTGSGKTLAFGVPLVERTRRGAAGLPGALVLVPTRELAAQVEDDLSDIAQARGLSVASVYGGVSINKQSRAARRADVLVACPGRLKDLIGRGAVSLDAVALLVLDEADRMLDMGFRKEVDRLVRLTPRDRQTLFFSATLEGEAGRQAKAYTRDARRHVHAATKARRAAVEHRFVRVAHERKISALVDTLSHDDGLSLVFVRTKRGADRLVKRLATQGVDAVAMHGNKTQAAREKALARFESGRVTTLVATDVAARGIDVDNVTHVINFDPPDTQDSYTHRIGRTARAGRTGVGITFVTPDQHGDVRALATGLRLQRELGEAVAA
jgi:superfamily II DNA/RNA helicase